MRLANKVALITGGASGIGKASCLLFAREGAKVVVVDLKQEAADETVREIRDAGGEAAAVAADVSKAKDAENMVAFAEKTFGRLDIAFNNAGVFHPDDDSVTNTSEEIWDMVIDVNLKGVFLGCKYEIPAMLRAGGGSIINTASFVAIMGAAA
ncbi:MAG TPA: SDR family NAD(P)-dependent oxidoreductase, partial [Thermoanaerobaculia bacterium]